MKKNDRRFTFTLDRPRLLATLIAAATTTVLFIISFTGTFNYDNFYFCSISEKDDDAGLIAEDYTTTPIQLLSILHYATSKVVPQQSLAEVRLSFDVLQSIAPCNFLVFGLGHDSLMWDSLNPGGTTVFIEEDQKWVRTVLHNSPILRAYTVRYRTQVSQADKLLAFYKSEKGCWPANVRIKGRCKLALSQLPEEVHDKEWDMIMIDAPRGYFPEAPGRMGAIYTAAVMARGRKSSGVTHVFLHDVNRKVEKAYAAEFLCMKYKVKGVGRLWHFMIPPAFNTSHATYSFC
ncbi:Glucuronoxylan 4-O-methyltransferase [Quillaja saponaria]|uniref:Glucuronoxylan 4-O-methyltransferase n=1 Tax=Quillaja saponaria TaxID=32244 RepID=A0AAD7P9I9_QUISA|nr:Glucuronoxylan 4-O-methyltransferase [Quillaja saponaria]